VYWHKGAMADGDAMGRHSAASTVNATVKQAVAGLSLESRVDMQICLGGGCPSAGYGFVTVIVPYGMVFNDDTKNAKSSEMPELLMDKTSA